MKALSHYFWQPYNFSYEEVMEMRRKGLTGSADLLYEWRVGFDMLSDGNIAELATWMRQQCSGVYGVDYRVSLANYAAFLKKEDALLCYLTFL